VHWQTLREGLPQPSSPALSVQENRQRNDSKSLPKATIQVRKPMPTHPSIQPWLQHHPTCLPSKKILAPVIRQMFEKEMYPKTEERKEKETKKRKNECEKKSVSPIEIPRYRSSMQTEPSTYVSLVTTIYPWPVRRRMEEEKKKEKSVGPP
jgi:hypothetical protein